MVDDNGNKFYENCNSMKEALEKIIELAEKGKEAVIGPKAPCIDCRTGKLIRNKNENAVGIYIVKEKDKVKKNKR